MTGLEDYKITWEIDENYKGEIKSEGEVLSELFRIMDEIFKDNEEWQQMTKNRYINEEQYNKRLKEQ